MTTLKAPFRGNSMKDLYEKVMKGVYDPIPNNFSRNLSEIIKSMLMQNPTFRPNCDYILRTISKKVSNLCINFPFNYDNDPQNYYNLVKSNNIINENNDNNNNEILIDKENNGTSNQGK